MIDAVAPCACPRHPQSRVRGASHRGREVRIAAEPRTEFGKGAARRTRRAGKVPAVLYGHGTDPRHMSLPAHELLLALKAAPTCCSPSSSTAAASWPCPRRCSATRSGATLEHVDLLLVRRGEKVTVEVPVT